MGKKRLGVRRETLPPDTICFVFVLCEIPLRYTRTLVP